MTDINPFQEAGSVLTAIRRSEKSRDITIDHARDRHADRVQKILAAASPEARELVVGHLKPVKPVLVSPAEAGEAFNVQEFLAQASECVNRADDQNRIHGGGEPLPAWTQEQPPPVDAVVIERGDVKGKGAGR